MESRNGFKFGQILSIRRNAGAQEAPLEELHLVVHGR